MRSFTLIEFRLRMYIAARVIRNIGVPDYQTGRRLWNAMLCLRNRNKASITTQPIFAQIETTTACNLSCRFCPNPELPQPRENLNYDQFIHILNTLPHLLVINFSGLGEPSLNKDIFRMASEARRRKIYIYTVTNLNLPEKTILGLADSDLNAINISLESADPERYKSYRLGGDFSRLESNLRLLCEMRAKNGRRFGIGFWATLTEGTIDSLEGIFQFAAKTRAAERIQVELALQKDDFVAAYDDALRAELFSDVVEAESRVRELLQGYSKRYGIHASLLGGSCKWPWGGISFKANGALAPCCNIRNDTLWGDIEDDSFEKRWHAEEWVDLRRGLLSGSLHPSCKGCSYARQ